MEISEEKLNELAVQHIASDYGPNWDEKTEDCSFTEMCKINYHNEMDSFKAGFYKALELMPFSKEEIQKTIHYMMYNELYNCIRNDGNPVDEKYIQGFINRLFNNIKEDRKHENKFF